MGKYIHIYEDNMWSFLKEKISENDIVVTDEEYKKFIENQKNGFEYTLKNIDASSINEAFELIKAHEDAKKPSIEQRVAALETLMMGVI